MAAGRGLPHGAALLELGVQVAEGCELAYEPGGAGWGTHLAARIEIPPAE